MGEKILVSNIIENQRIEIARYINKAYFLKIFLRN